ncbi:hypothetical protein FM110_03760 [Brachybacterium nesterenkovii]|uniref:Calpain catalytic domain-containing protein n=1 Tax=Brachybacterium nesterenkovii TaxID=47847 RepID=A0A1X6WVQ3_9MICO|nr:hypothetical protein FM110_03760 [Brachybacterium nesterenkovii]
MTWQGPDADAFRAAVRGRIGGRGRAVAEDLSARAQELDRDAQEQEEASDGGDGASADGTDGGPENPEERNKFWWFEDGFAPFWGKTADLQDDIPLGREVYTFDNVDQEDIGNCLALAYLATIAKQDPEFIQNHIKRVDKEKHEVILYDSAGNPTTYTVTGDVLRTGVRGQDGNQNWMTIYEAALIQAGLLDENGEYASQRGGTSFAQAVTGSSGTVRWDGGGYDQSRPSFEQFAQEITSGQPTILGTRSMAGSDDLARSQGVEPLQLVENHAYMVDSVNDDGTITIVNPWGAGDLDGKNEDGAHRMTITKEQYQLYFDAVYSAKKPSEWKR